MLHLLGTFFHSKRVRCVHYKQFYYFYRCKLLLLTVGIIKVEDYKQLLVEKDAVLQKFPGKGGWVHVLLPEVPKSSQSWFGLVKVNGRIDNYEFSDVNLMPDRNNIMFLAVNANIRKQIGKSEGELVHVVLYAAGLPGVGADDFSICLKEEPIALKRFEALSTAEQRQLIDWIYAPKNDELKVARMAQAIDNLLIVK